MSDIETISAYGEQIEPRALRIQRLLPGAIERVWAYLTESDLRRQWLAAGPMELKVGGEVELIWRNDELSAQPDPRPPSMESEHRLKSRITRFDPPRLLTFEWGGSDVTFELEALGKDVMLTVTHRRLSDRNGLLNVSAGWHAHLDVLADRLWGRSSGPFWSAWSRLKTEYDARLAP